MRVALILSVALFLFSNTAQADIGVYNNPEEFHGIADMGMVLNFERSPEVGGVGDVYLSRGSAGGMEGGWSQNGIELTASNPYYFYWRDEHPGFLYGAGFYLGEESTDYLEIVPPVGATALSFNVTGFYVGDLCDVMLIEVETGDGAVRSVTEFTHSTLGTVSTWADFQSKNGFLGIVSDVPILSVRIRILDSSTYYTYDFVVLDNVSAGTLLDPGSIGHTPEEFHGCEPDSYPFEEIAQIGDPVELALVQCEADLSTTQTLQGTCEQELASARTEVVVEYVEVEKIEEVPANYTVETALAFLRDHPVAVKAALKRWKKEDRHGNRSGLGDGANPGKGKGRENATNTGSLNPHRTGGGIWELAQLADVDGDGDLDLIYVGVSGGAVGLLRIKIIQNGAPTGAVGFIPTAGGGWVLIAAGDLNGDGTHDLIFQGTTSVRVDFMNGTAVLSQAFLSNGGGVWTVAAVGDASGDGKEDLWWVGETGTAAQDLSRLQEMDGANVLSTIYPQTGGGSLVPMFIADANGVGDLFLAGATVNRLDVMTGNSLSISVARFFGNGGGTYMPSVTGDFNGDGKQDLASEGPNDVLVQLLDADLVNPVIAQSQIPNGTGFWDLFLD